LLKSGTICDIQNPTLVFQNELEKCDIICNHQNNLKSLERNIIVDNSNFKMYISQRNKAKYFVRKPCFGVVQSKERYKRNPRRDRAVIGDGITNSMTPADGGGAVEGPVEGESMGDNEGGDGDVGADKGGVVEGEVDEGGEGRVDEGGVDEVGVETGAKVGAGAGADVVISS
jgi:hypothetical protein